MNDTVYVIVATTHSSHGGYDHYDPYYEKDEVDVCSGEGYFMDLLLAEKRAHELNWDAKTVEFWEKSEKSNESRAEEIRDRVKEANREAKILRDNGIDRKGKKVPAKYKPVSFETFKSRLDTYTTYTVVELNPAEQPEQPEESV